MRKFARFLCFLVFLTSGMGFAAALSLAQEPPRITKVEPPNWWTGLPGPMLLLRGENLSSAQVRVSDPDVRVEKTAAGAGDNYLFVWLSFAARLQPRTIDIQIETPGGSTRLGWPVIPRLSRADNFRGFGEDDVIYLIMPDRFADGDASNNEPVAGAGTYDRKKARAFHGGDLRGIRNHLSYLRDLGVTAIWLNPIYANDSHSPEDYHGYGAVDYYGVDAHFGTLAELRELVKAGHEQGIKMILDQVPNHTGPRHPWAKEPPEPDWLHGSVASHLTARSPMDNVIDLHAPPRFWRDMVEGWFAGLLPDLNQENPDVARYLVQNSVWWAEATGIDGYRLDTYPYLTRNFWAAWHKGLRSAEPSLTTVGEVFHPDPTVTSFFAGGRKQYDGVDSGVSTVFDFPLFFALRNVCLRGAPASQFVDVLRRDWLYPHPEKLVTFIGNHDTKRWMGEPGATPESLKLAYSLLLTLRGIPQLYSGDEIGMPGGDDPDNRRDFPGGFPGDPTSAFTPSGRTPEQEAIFSHLQALLRLRKEHVALRRGQQWHIGWGADFYAYARITAEERVLVLVNTSGSAKKLTLPLSDTPLANAGSLDALSSGAGPATLHDGQLEAAVAARSAAIYLVK